MARRTRGLLVGLGLVVLVGGGLAGCATGTPGGSGADLDAAWLDAGRAIGLVTVGSSSCVPMAEEATLEDDGSLAVTFVEPEADTACTADLVPRVTLVGVPEGVDPSQNLRITVTGAGYDSQTELDGVAGLTPGGSTDYAPSAGWTDADGTFVLLTWGSSTCVPVIEDVEATEDAEVTVTFETPRANQVCTMDMAPRGQVVTVTDLESGSNVIALLTGAEFDDVAVAIIGEN